MGEFYEPQKRIIMKKISILLISILFMIATSCSNKVQDDPNTLFVYNWGLYLDETVIGMFEEKYDCKVVYDEFDTNEEMYAVVSSNGRLYDVLCPTDYMIEKMIKKDMLYEYDITVLSNYSNIDPKILKIISSFDKNNSYVVPYVHSTLGMIYNKTQLDDMGLPYPKKWADMWREEYKGELLMQDAMRDLLMVGLKKNNFSINTLEQTELDKATSDLIEQKHLVNAYMIDDLRDKMVAGNGSIAVMYSGEVEYIKENGSSYKYEYILPEEGVNFTIDAWVIPKNARHKELAKKWIDFMLDPEIALLNFDEMHYGIANLKTIELIKNRDGESVIKNEAIFPNLDDIDKYELYRDLGSFEENYNESYKRIKSYKVPKEEKEHK